MSNGKINAIAPGFQSAVPKISVLKFTDSLTFLQIERDWEMNRQTDLEVLVFLTNGSK
jgi:hypothetical protein